MGMYRNMAAVCSFLNPSSQRMWIKAAGFALLTGSVLMCLALQSVLQVGISWSQMLGVTSLTPFQPSPSHVIESWSSSCLSRTQQMNYRPASQSISNSASWEKAFRDYKKFHNQCSQGRNWTLQFLEDATESNHSRDSHHSASSCGVLVYVEGSAGMGNRLLSLVSAFLYSLLTNRVFLLDSRGHLPELLCEPFSDSSWLLSSNFPFKALDEATTLGEFDQAAALAGDFSAQVVKLQLDHDQTISDQRFFCAETRKALELVPWLVWTSNQYYGPRFFTFPELWEPLTALFPNVSLTFTHLSRSLLLPSNSVWDKVTRMYSSYLTHVDQLLGVQIRRHSVDDRGRYDEAAFHRILHCLTGRKFLPNVGLSNGSMRQESQTPGRYSPPRVNYAVLVTSLQIKFFEELRDLYTNVATVDRSLVRVHMVSHEGVEWHSFDQDQKAFIEMWLLSLSDRIVTSSMSTFGYIAQGLGALRPLVVDLRGEISEQTSASMESVCYFGQSIEPCNHHTFYPTGSNCAVNQTTLSDIHLAWIRSNLLPCQDAPAGLQLAAYL
ncbi:hypothetical protein R1flu_009702 [Riccia fluitans]|uniref:Fucosyltransferase n=1 Tax=Riccia fluitans TaxID=41844 RepID=A0ABD1Z326_9MARC